MAGSVVVLDEEEAALASLVDKQTEFNLLCCTSSIHSVWRLAGKAWEWNENTSTAHLAMKASEAV